MGGSWGISFRGLRLEFLVFATGIILVGVPAAMKLMACLQEWASNTKDIKEISNNMAVGPETLS